MDKLPLRQSIIARAGFAAAGTEAFASLAGLDVNFNPLFLRFGQPNVAVDKLGMTFFQIQNSFDAQLHGDHRARCEGDLFVMATIKKIIRKARYPSDYLSDINEWPRNWRRIEKDLKTGRGLLAQFTPFIQNLIDGGLARKTIQSHGYHLSLLASEIIERLNQGDEENRKLSPRNLILHYVDDEGGPLLSFWSPDIKSELAQHMAYDATCRKLLKFMTQKNL